jgi:thymidylate synthase
MELILAHDKYYGIAGPNGDLPWSMTEAGRTDMRFFSQMTKGNIVAMGATTFASRSIACKPLPKRLNIVVTRRNGHRGRLSDETRRVMFSSVDAAVESWVVGTTGLLFVDTIDKMYRTCMRLIQRERGAVKAFLTGGASLVDAYITQGFRLTHVHLNEIPGDSYNCATFIGDVAKTRLICCTARDFVETACKKTGLIMRTLYNDQAAYGNEGERDYLQLLRDCAIAKLGYEKQDRTGEGTYSMFSQELRFRLYDEIVQQRVLPLLTTKRMATKAMFTELAWFVRGETDTKILERDGCRIWSGNTSREFLDSRGLTDYPEGELGPGYGFQWRFAGAEYPSREGGVDQLQGLIDMLKTDPDSRRMVMSAWNPKDLPKMALPPCHMMLNLWTRVDPNTNQRYLRGKVIQRSADAFLGVPFNIGSYGALLHYIADKAGMIAEELVLSFSDFHVYKTHLEQVAMQCGDSRFPVAFPTLEFPWDNDPKMEAPELDDLKHTDFIVKGYVPQARIPAPMAV